jgi:hypothetical protein
MVVVLLAGLALMPASAAVVGTQTDIVGPVGSGHFGRTVTLLTTGNIVVTDPYYDAGSVTDVGAVYLYNGATGALINTLTGSTAGDQVGFDVTALANGNYVVCSSEWDNGVVTNAGAATWCSGTAGCGGVVTLTNSLVGSAAGDQVGLGGVEALSNGHYVVLSRYWDNGAVTNAGAATWGNGATGITGVVTLTNSLVGSKINDLVGDDVTALSNGNYVVLSPDWNDGATVGVGAATWGNGATGITGVVTLTNSLVGSTASDNIGRGGAIALSNGNYVVISIEWSNGGATEAGAVTWGSGTTGITGTVSATNSLVGSTAYERVGFDVTPLVDGDYVVFSINWDNGAAMNVGAVTWGNGITGITGVVTLTNSLVGSTANDRVGYGGVEALSNGNYVVLSPEWDNGAATEAGAATWGNGATGITGVVTVANSLVGSAANDRVGSGRVTALANGHYVVSSRDWNNGGVAGAGAVTWGNGTTGISGVVSVTNSLVGSTYNEQVGVGVTALANGHYVVGTPYWDNGAVTNVGAVMWVNGTTGITGVFTAANSLVGSTADDQICNATALSNGNYVVYSPWWDNGAAMDAGAVTWGNGITGITGVVTLTNSLVGSKAGDEVGIDVTALSNGNYVVFSTEWDNGAAANAGAVTWGNGSGGSVGTITAENSVRGTAAGGGSSMVFDYDYIHHRLVVGRRADNIVTLFIGEYVCYLPIVLRNATP